MTDYQPPPPPPAPPPAHFQPPRPKRNKWKVAGAILGGLFLLGLFAGGADETDDQPSAVDVSPATTVDESPPTTGYLVPDDLFAAFIQTQLPNLDLSDSEIIAFAHGVCADLDAGESVMEIGLDIIDEYPSTYGDMAFILGAGVENYCPSHSWQLDEFNETWS